ncbi:hypothetical protein AURANDRAFT_69135, partial [Aureococcus anophagefferens]
VALALYTDDAVAWYENDGAMSFAEHVVADGKDGPAFVFGEDVDGDGDVDVLTAASKDDTLLWYENVHADDAAEPGAQRGTVGRAVDASERRAERVSDGRSELGAVGGTELSAVPKSHGDSHGVAVGRAVDEPYGEFYLPLPTYRKYIRDINEATWRSLKVDEGRGDEGDTLLPAAAPSAAAATSAAPSAATPKPKPKPKRRGWFFGRLRATKAKKKNVGAPNRVEDATGLEGEGDVDEGEGDVDEGERDGSASAAPSLLGRVGRLLKSAWATTRRASTDGVDKGEGSVEGSFGDTGDVGDGRPAKLIDPKPIVAVIEAAFPGVVEARDGVVYGLGDGGNERKEIDESHVDAPVS